MPKILTFPKPRKWKLPSIGLIPGGEDLHLTLAFDLPIVLVRQLIDLQKLVRPKAEGLRWLEARDFILPLLEIPNARSEAIEAVDARLRASVKEGFRGRLRANGVFSAGEGGTRAWVQVEDSELLWLRLRDWLATMLSKDGFEVVKLGTPKIPLAEAPNATETTGEPPFSAPAFSAAFHVFDLVLYGRHRSSADPLYSAISFASLDAAKVP